MEHRRHSYHRNPRKMRHTRVTIPTAVGPHVKLVFAEMARQNVTYDEVEEWSGVLRSTVKAWRHKNAPGLTTIEAVLGCLGWDFVPVPRSKVLPKALLDELVPLAERHGLTMPKTIEALVEIVVGLHDGTPPPFLHAENVGEGTDRAPGILPLAADRPVGIEAHLSCAA